MYIMLLKVTFSSLSSVAAFTFNWSDVDILRKARVNFIS